MTHLFEWDNIEYLQKLFIGKDVFRMEYTIPYFSREFCKLVPQLFVTSGSSTTDNRLRRLNER
ncbi:hypothetical protein Hanom_Chr08g00731861 [Helianthus anomalus]